MADWTKTDRLHGGETWTVDGFDSGTATQRLCLGEGDQLRISKVGLGKPKLVPRPGTNWSRNHDKGNAIKLEKHNTFSDGRRVYRFTVTVNVDGTGLCTTEAGGTPQERTFYLLEEEPDEDHILISDAEPKDTGGADGGSASLRR